MSESSQKETFLAVLIYEDGPGRRCEEPRVYAASHPDIAYHLALSDGNEQRFGRRFLGLSRLEVTTREVEPISCSQDGEASELVIYKDGLAAFSDPRWKGVKCDENEIGNALRQPPLLFEIEGIDAVPWHQFTHAYGTASEVPRDIRRLASSDPEIRKQALWQLFGSIYHQGTLYSATSAATPFLLQLAIDKRHPDRSKPCELLNALAESAAVDPAKLRQTWAWRRKHFGEIYSKPTTEMAEQEVENVLAVRRALLSRLADLRRLRYEDDPEVAKLAESILNHLDRCEGAT